LGRGVRRGEGGERGGYGQPRRLESREPNAPSALRAYSPERAAATDTVASASWALFEPAFSIDYGDKVEVRRRGTFVRSRARNVVLCMTRKKVGLVSALCRWRGSRRS
jgi:hypothetical protein